MSVEAWQIGSRAPPSVCLCCGTKFDEDAHRLRGPYTNSPYIYVCQKCWERSYLFFPDKDYGGPARALEGHATKHEVAKTRNAHLINISMRLKSIAEVEEMANDNFLDVPAIRGNMKGLDTYSTKMKARQLLALWNIKEFKEDRLDGYQRQRLDERAHEVADYLKSCAIPVMPAVLASFQDGVAFNAKGESDVGMLKIPTERGVLNIIDGQHRLAGFDVIKQDIAEMEDQIRLGEATSALKDDMKAYDNILDYEVPVLFVNAQTATEIVQKTGAPKVGPEDIERTLFYVVNKTAKSIRPSLKDTLQSLIKLAGISGIPAVDKDEWRTQAARVISTVLNRNGSPLSGKINTTGARGLGRPIQLNSFITSVEPLFRDNEDFRGLSATEKGDFLKTYWSVLKEMFPDPFLSPRGYLLLKTIGVYALNHLANDIFNWCKGDVGATSIRRFLKPLTDFNWAREESELKALGGIAGVNEAHERLLKQLANAEIKEAKQKIEEMEGKKAKRKMAKLK